MCWTYNFLFFSHWKKIQAHISLVWQRLYFSFPLNFTGSTSCWKKLKYSGPWDIHPFTCLLRCPLSYVSTWVSNDTAFAPVLLAPSGLLPFSSCHWWAKFALGYLSPIVPRCVVCLSPSRIFLHPWTLPQVCLILIL